MDGTCLQRLDAGAWKATKSIYFMMMKKSVNQRTLCLWAVLMSMTLMSLMAVVGWFPFFRGLLHIKHYSDVIIGAMASKTTGVSIVSPTVCSGAYQIKHQTSVSLASGRGIHQWPVKLAFISLNDCIIMCLSWPYQHIDQDAFHQNMIFLNCYYDYEVNLQRVAVKCHHNCLLSVCKPHECWVTFRGPNSKEQWNMLRREQN